MRLVKGKKLHFKLESRQNAQRIYRGIFYEMFDEMDEIERQKEIKKSEKEFADWINELDCLPTDYKVIPKENLFPDINL